MNYRAVKMERACLANLPVYHTCALYKFLLTTFYYYCICAYDFKVNTNNYDRAAKTPGGMFIFGHFRAVHLIPRRNSYYYYYCYHYFLYTDSASTNDQLLNL